jgi:hypothetical protein
MRILLFLLVGLLPFAARADEEVTICYNWGCHAEARVVFDVNDLLRIGALFDDVDTAALERASIQLAIGMMERIAGEQTPTRNDRGGNVNDDGVDGRMDCIDHSHNTTAYLRLLERRGLLRFHRVLDPVERAPWLVDVHWAARIQELDSGAQYVVDSWFFDNGQPAAIFTLQDWKHGATPHG